MHPLTRRELLRRCSLGFGGIALSGLLASPAFGAEAAGKRPLKAKAKNVIFCYMSGGVSHVDTFDPKPKLAELYRSTNPSPLDFGIGYRHRAGESTLMVATRKVPLEFSPGQATTRNP